jgi:hypothetical protein
MKVAGINIPIGNPDVPALVAGGVISLGLLMLLMGNKGMQMAGNLARAYGAENMFQGIQTDTYALQDTDTSWNDVHNYNSIPWIGQPTSTYDPTQPNFSAIGGYTPPSSLWGY